MLIYALRLCFFVVDGVMCGLLVNYLSLVLLLLFFVPIFVCLFVLMSVCSSSNGSTCLFVLKSRSAC